MDINSAVNVCDKGDILLKSYILQDNNQKAYTMSYTLKSIDSSKININSLVSPEIYELMERINPELIEKIYILNKISEIDTDILILLKPIAKELGMKQKFILFRTSKQVTNTNTIIFYNRDLSLIDNELYTSYLNQTGLNLVTYEQMIFNYGKTVIQFNNIEFDGIKKILNHESNGYIVDLEFSIAFQLLIKDDLPIYMEHFIGLMFKKLFYNLKQFIDKLNTSYINK
tara:strand:+ start:4558 stop:5241 length:684 start_codon:yes stop_codon:yes gene_type:complete